MVAERKEPAPPGWSRDGGSIKIFNHSTQLLSSGAYSQTPFASSRGMLLQGTLAPHNAILLVVSSSTAVSCRGKEAGAEELPAPHRPKRSMLRKTRPPGAPHRQCLPESSASPGLGTCAAGRRAAPAQAIAPPSPRATRSAGWLSERWQPPAAVAVLTD